DVIVVSLDSSGAGALEAADLVQSGIATRVAVFTDPPSGEDHEFIRRGLPYDDAGARHPEPTLEPKVKARCSPHGVIGTSSDLLCSWPLGTTRDECGECSIES